MEEIRKQLATLKNECAVAAQRIKLEEKTHELKTLETQMAEPSFWQDQQTAQRVSKVASDLKNRIEPWQQIIHDLAEIEELVALNDSEMNNELAQQLSSIADRLSALKKQLRFNGQFDTHDAIVGIYAGAGGTDAQDWAAMLLRMYIRWAEKQGASVQTIDQSSGEEAGIKSATVQLSGSSFLYGKLHGEHGVHRLVRLSPFNSDNLRQTSFAKVEVLPLIDAPELVALDDKDLKIDVYRAGGHGGQSVNTTDSAVRVTHLPTGISVAIQNERSQLQNKETALSILRSRLAQLQVEQHKDALADIKGPNQSAEWGNQIRSYVLHPYKQVKDLRSGYTSTDPDAVLDGDLDQFIDALAETPQG